MLKLEYGKYSSTRGILICILALFVCVIRGVGLFQKYKNTHVNDLLESLGCHVCSFESGQLPYKIIVLYKTLENLLLSFA